MKNKNSLLTKKKKKKLMAEACKAGSLDDSCKSNHILAKLNKNFGAFYVGKETPSSIFPNICTSCLLAKYGLYEDYEFDTVVNMANCNFPSPKNREGPYLKAFKPTFTLYNNQFVTFEKNTIIIPCGQILIDLLSSDKDFIYNRNFEGPSIRLKKNNELYSLNPYLYSYFRSLRNLHHDQVDVKSISKNYSLIEKMMANTLYTLPSVNMIVHEGDQFLHGNFLTPDSYESLYAQGKQLNSINNVTIEINNLPYTPENDASKIEDILDTKSLYVNAKYLTDSTDMKEAKSHQIKQLNTFVKTLVMNTRVAIINSKPRLKEYFRNNKKSAAQLYVSSFCMPANVIENNDVIRQFLPNCAYYEGIGLVAIEPICRTDFLVVDEAVNAEQLIYLKMCNPENLIEYYPDTIDIPKHATNNDSCSRGVQDNKDNLPTQRSLLYNSLMMN